MKCIDAVGISGFQLLTAEVVNLVKMLQRIECDIRARELDVFLRGLGGINGLSDVLNVVLFQSAAEVIAT